MAKNKSSQTTNTQRSYTPGQTSFQQNLDSNVIPSFMNQFNTAQARGASSYDEIMNNYRSFLNRPTYGAGLPGGGARNPVTGAPGANTGGGVNPYSAGDQNPANRDYVRQQIAQSMIDRGITPSQTRGTGANDVEYYTDQAMGTGGWTPDNAGYWQNRIGTDAARGGTGGGGWSNFFGTAPSFPGFNSPAYGYFQNFAQGGGNVGFDPEAQGAISDALGSYRNFVQTGGFSPQDIADMRARAISPTRAVYQNALQNVQRQRALQPYSPNAIAAQAKMARDVGQNISDANVNANAAIAQAVQQGKEFGTSGLSTTGLNEAQIKAAIDQFNQSMKMSGAQGMSGLDQFAAQLQQAYDQLGFQYANMNANTGLGYDTLATGNALKGMAGATDLYGTVPGESRLAAGNLMDVLGLENTSLNNPAGGVNTTQNTPMTAMDYMQMFGSGIDTGMGVYDDYKKAQAARAAAANSSTIGENARLSAPSEVGSSTYPSLTTGGGGGVGLTASQAAGLPGAAAGLYPTLTAGGMGTMGIPSSTLATLPGYAGIPSASAVSGIPFGEGAGAGIAGGGGGVSAGAPSAAASSSSAAGGMGAAEFAGNLAGAAGIPLALMFAINKWTGGPSQYNTGGFMSNYTPFGRPSGIQDANTRRQAQMTAAQMELQYGPDDPQTVQFKMLNGIA